MENRLLYMAGNTPETSSESPKFSGDGEKEFLEIKKKIESLGQNDLDQSNFEKVTTLIGKLYKDINQSPKGMMGAYKRGDFFKELYTLVRDKWQLEKIAGAKGSIKYDESTKDIALLFCFFADPEKAAKDFIEALPEHLPEADVMKLVDIVKTTASLYASSNSAKYTAYVKHCLQALYDRYDDPFGKELPSWMKPLSPVHSPKPDTSKVSRASAEFRTWLVHQKDHFEFEVFESLDWLGDAGRAELKKQSEVFQNDGSEGDFGANPDLFESALKNLGTVENSTAVNTVLAKGGLDVTGNTDPNDPLFYARPKVYMMLAWAFYRGLGVNPNATKEQRQEAYENHNKVFETYPKLRPNVDLKEERAGAADETAEEATDGGSMQILTDVNLGNPPDAEASKLLGEIRQGEQKFDSLKNQIIMNLSGQGAEVKTDDLLNTILELKAKMKTLYGIDQIVSLNPSAAANFKQAEEMIESFGLALQNANKLPGYRVKLEEMEGLDGGQYAARAGELQAMLGDLQNMTYLPPEAIKIHKAILARTQKLYTKWVAVLKLPPKIEVSRAPKGVGRAPDFYEEDDLNEYTYSPMMESADEGDESFEVPEIMHTQINRIRVIQCLAESLGMGADGMVGHLESVESELIEYYMGDKYDGVTTFNLDARLKAFPKYGEFTADLKRLWDKGLGKKVVYAGRGATVVYTEKSKLTAYLCDKFDLGTGELDGKVAEWKANTGFGAELIKVLDGGSNVDISDIKRAGSAIAVFQRRVLNDFMSARALMVKLLEPQLAGARKRAEEDKNLTGELRGKASYEAVMQLHEYMENKHGRIEIESSIKAAYAAANNGAEMPAELLKENYGEVYNVMINAQTEIIYGMYLNWASISKNFMNPAMLTDPVDGAILAEFYKSVDPDGGTWRLSDEIKATMTQVGGFMAHMVKDIGLMMVSGGTAFVVGAGMRKWYQGSKIAKYLLSATRFKKGAEILFGVGRLAVGLTTEAAIFAQMYPWMAEGVFGKEQTTLIEAFQKGEGLRKLAGEVAMFGVFHGMSWLRSFMRRTGAGKSLMAEGLKNPEAIPEIAEVLKIAEMDGAKAMEALKAFIPKIKNPQVKQIAEDNIGSINLLKEQYTRLVEGIPARFVKTKKLVQFMVMDLQFDAAAMLIGGLVKQGIYDERKAGEAEATIGQTLLQAYGGALAFRGAFTVVKSGGKWVKDVWNNNSVTEGVPQIRKAIEGADGEMAKLDAEFINQTAGLRARIDVLRSEAAAITAQKRAARSGILKNRPKGKNPRELLREASLIDARLKALEARLTEAKAPFERFKAERQAEIEAVMSQLTGERKLGDFAVPSRIARFLPKRLIRQLYKDYQVNGEFVGSDGLTKMLLSDFPAALKMIEGAKRSLLSVNQILVVSSRLNGEQCLKFLEAQGKIMTRREKSYFFHMVETMGIAKESIPEWSDHVKLDAFGFEKPAKPDGTPRGDRSSLGEDAALGLNQTREGRWRMILAEALVGGGLVLGVLTGSGAKTPAVERPNPALVMKVKAADFQPEGNGRFYIPEKGDGRFEPMPKATKDSQVVLIDAKGAETGDVNMVREWNAKTGFDFLAQDQKSIFEGMKGAGIPEGTLVGMTQLYENLPDMFKNHVKIFAIADEGGKVREFYVVDEEGMRKELETLRPKIEAAITEEFQVLVDAGLLDPEVMQADALSWISLVSIAKLFASPAFHLFGLYLFFIKKSGDLTKRPESYWGDPALLALLLWAVIASGEAGGNFFERMVAKGIGFLTPYPWNPLPFMPIISWPAGLGIIALALYRSKLAWRLKDKLLPNWNPLPKPSGDKDPTPKNPDGTPPEGGAVKVPGVHLPKHQVPSFDNSFVIASYNELGIEASGIPIAIYNRLYSSVKAALKDTHSKLEDLFTNHLNFAPEKLAEAQNHFRNLFKLQQASLIEAECSKVLKDSTATLDAGQRKALEGVRDQAAAARTKLIGEIFGKQDFVNQIHELDLNGQMKVNDYIGKIFLTSLRSRAFDKGEMNAAWETKLARLEKNNPEEVSNFVKRILAKRNFEKDWRDSHFTEKEIAQIEKGFKDLSAVLAENPGALEALAQIAAIRAQLKALKPEYVKAKRRVEIAKKRVEVAKKKGEAPQDEDLKTIEQDRKTIDNYDKLEKGIADAKSRLKGIKEKWKGLDPKIRMAIFSAVGLAIAGGVTYYFMRPKPPEAVEPPSEAQKAQDEIDEKARIKSEERARRASDAMEDDDEASENRPDEF